MTRADKFLMAAIRFLLASAFVGACLLCEATLWLGYFDSLYRSVMGALFGG